MKHHRELTTMERNNEQIIKFNVTSWWEFERQRTRNYRAGNITVSRDYAPMIEIMQDSSVQEKYLTSQYEVYRSTKTVHSNEPMEWVNSGRY